ncbi:serine hydrolase domain-containing protein [Luteibacter sp. CQ10]|uniref:serine hydrolase domain-containing protein n=1 Tax=Luteibacter sp. CQ10 TaxID=2805821 RepID=UPI0034A599BB
MKMCWMVASMLLAVSTVASGEEVPAWTSRVDAIVDTIAKDGPGATVAVSQGGRIVYAQARGLASMELGVPMETGSVLRIGSLTKTITAASILRLQAQGRIDLDARLSTWLHGFPHAKDITVRELLTHTSGVSDGWDVPLTDVLDTPGLVRHIGSVPLDFAPGTDWRYSNSGYMLLGALLEKITGKPWYQAENDLVLAPLGLTHTGFHDDAAIVPRMASGYSVDAAGKVVRPVAYSISGPGAAGGMTSTASDIAMLLHGMATGNVPGRQAFQAMSTPARIGDVDLPYGMGMVPGTLRGTAVVEHSGGIEGYSAHYVYLPGEDIAVAVLENSDAPTWLARSLAHRIAATVMGRPYRFFAAKAWSASSLGAVAGTYAIKDGGCHAVVVKNGSAWIRRDDGPQRKLDAASDDVLVYAGDGIDYLRPERDRSGAVTGLEFHADGADTGRVERRVAACKGP